jgi:ribosomal protein S18 acetylase RimI-like enzyme
MMDDLQLVTAGQEDVVAIQQMLSTASRRAAEMGYRQWWDPFPRQIVEESVSRGETFLAVENGRITATLALSWSDPLFWGQGPPDAGYVHRLCRDPALAKKGLGRHLLNWAATRTGDRGRRWLRLDTPAANRRLRKYYEALGFDFQGETNVLLVGASGEEELWRAALYQRAVFDRGESQSAS